MPANFLVGDAYDLQLEDNSFDLVFSIGVFEHFEDIATPIKEQIRILDKGGLFIAYIVPEYKDNIQKDFYWINEILKGQINSNNNDPSAIQTNMRFIDSDRGSEKIYSSFRKIWLNECFFIWNIPSTNDFTLN